MILFGNKDQSHQLVGKEEWYREGDLVKDKGEDIQE